jgi:hypothetical protein
MGTRCDFYVGRGEKAEWIGSVAWDGHPECFDSITSKTTEAEFRKAVAEELDGRDDGTKPEMGWPWPWENSLTTDYAIAFEDGHVWASCFGRKWYDPANPPEDDMDGGKVAVFPNMKDRQKVALDGRSGLIFVSTKD